MFPVSLILKGKREQQKMQLGQEEDFPRGGKTSKPTTANEKPRVKIQKQENVSDLQYFEQNVAINLSFSSSVLTVEKIRRKRSQKSSGQKLAKQNNKSKMRNLCILSNHKC